MAYVSQNQPVSIWESIKGFFSSIGHALTMSAAAEVRMRRIEALNAKSDAELAAMNLRRSDIPAYVFRDLMHI